MRPATIELNVSPLERDRLADPQPGSRKQLEQQSMPRVDEREERGELLARAEANRLVIVVLDLLPLRDLRPGHSGQRARDRRWVV